MFAAQFDQHEGIADALKASPVVFTPFDIQINAFRLHKSETGKRHTFVRQNGPEPRHAVVLRDGDDGLAAAFADADHQHVRLFVTVFKFLIDIVIHILFPSQLQKTITYVTYYQLSMFMIKFLNFPAVSCG